ncbi:hypothetical protein EV175_005252 [Coemansia sp. RSA 1933]|nr:hypothetical protein EV175_005252 [Coemansia sp. RSA 1933]
MVKATKEAGAPPLKYKEAANASKAAGVFTLEVVKQGSLVETHDIGTDRTYFTFGRLPTCDFPMEHESVSRYHAVLQFVDDGRRAQLVDLGSSHGTYVNKQRVRPDRPVVLGIGDQIKFGMSSRIWVFGSNDESILEESCDGHDSSVIEQSNIKKSAYARDPVKYLRTILAENEYSYEPMVIAEGGAGTSTGFGEETAERVYFVQISLPFDDHDGNALAGVAKASKRQDAERLACLDALKKLGKHGYMNRSKALADPYNNSINPDDDGGDDDDDVYYDRTLLHSKCSAGSQNTKEPPETFTSLCVKLAQVDADIARIERSLKDLGAELPENQTGNDDVDELDAYMDTLAQSEKKGDRRKLDEQLSSLRKQKDRLEALVKLVAPDDDDTVQPGDSQKSRSDLDTVRTPSVPIPKRRRVQGPSTREGFKSDTTVSTPVIKAKKEEEEEEEESWQPPQDQIGDGRTLLNEKYGY